MKYSNEVIINAPINRVIELFDNADNLKHWMTGLQSFEHLSGTPGQQGAKSKMVFLHGKRRMEMIETILVRDLPAEFTGQYDTQGAVSTTRNRFIDLGNGTTRYINDNEFQFSGFLKIIAWLMPGAFKKQSQKFMEDFKRFVESRI